MFVVVVVVIFVVVVVFGGVFFFAETCYVFMIIFGNTKDKFDNNFPFVVVCTFSQISYFG